MHDEPTPVQHAATHCAELHVELLNYETGTAPVSPETLTTLRTRCNEARHALVLRCIEESAARRGLTAKDVRMNPSMLVAAAFEAGAMYDLALYRKMHRASSSRSLTQYDLNDRRCRNPECHCETEGVVLHSRCHIDAPAWAFYDPEFGRLTLRCAECDHAYATVAVARGGSEAPDGTWLTDELPR